MSEEKSVVISTHQVRDIDRLLDHVIVIDGSQVLLDESVVRITDKLFFAEQGMSDPTDDALYVQPSVQRHPAESLWRREPVEPGTVV